jgi:hypothetical protein
MLAKFHVAQQLLLQLLGLAPLLQAVLHNASCKDLGTLSGTVVDMRGDMG